MVTIEDQDCNQMYPTVFFCFYLTRFLTVFNTFLTFTQYLANKMKHIFM